MPHVAISPCIYRTCCKPYANVTHRDEEEEEEGWEEGEGEEEEEAEEWEEGPKGQATLKHSGGGVAQGSVR